MPTPCSRHGESVMAGNNVQRNFVGDTRPCPRCKATIEVTASMVKRKKYTCGPCESQMAVDWARRNRERKRASNNRYIAARSGERAARTAAWRTNHPEKWRAHQAVQTALRNGTLTKRPCEVCGSTVRIHGHHDDYSKPLEVIWLCHSHHMERHAMLAARTQEAKR